MSDGGIEKRALSIGAAYVVVVAVLFQWGYWAHFGINILQYMSLQDVVKSFVWPFAASFLALFVGMMIGHFLNFDLLAGMGKSSKVGEFLNKYGDSIAKGYVGVIFLVLFFGGKQSILAAAFLALPFLSLLATQHPIVRTLIPNPEVRRLLVFAGIGMPLLAYPIGKARALHVTDSIYYDEATLSDVEPKMKFIGAAGEHLFFLTLDNKSVQIRLASSVPKLVLTRISKE